MHAKASKFLACASEKTIQVSWCFVSDMGAKDLAVASIPACIHETVNFIQPNGSWESRTRGLMREAGIDDVSPAVYGKYLAQHPPHSRHCCHFRGRQIGGLVAFTGSI